MLQITYRMLILRSPGSFHKSRLQTTHAQILNDGNAKSYKIVAAHCMEIIP